MRKFYEEYHDLSNLPPVVAKLPWSHNSLLVEKIKDKNIRKWYAKKCYENGWSKTVLDHQIDSGVYERQAIAQKLTNFDNKLPMIQSELARDMMKDPYIFELEGIKDKYIERDIGNTICIQPGQTEMGNKELSYAIIDTEKDEYNHYIDNV